MILGILNNFEINSKKNLILYPEIKIYQTNN